MLRRMMFISHNVDYARCLCVSDAIGIQLKIAKWFEEREEVEQVLHPALPSCPGHEIWKRDFTGSSGLFSVVLKPH
nr:PLP-dependent transferase [Klebsiella pneumoniae subsp. pneumoniae]